MKSGDDNHSVNDDDCDDVARQGEELEALQAFYGDDVLVNEQSWELRIANGIDLKIFLPSGYPSSVPPIPIIQAPAFVVDKEQKKELERQLIEMYQLDTEVAILWTEHLRSLFDDETFSKEHDTLTDKADCVSKSDSEGLVENDETRSFHPSSSKFGQPARHFNSRIIDDKANYREIFRGKPFHPPKSGPAETMLAHVACVESMKHVDWVLAKLMFEDKKVSKASHNMIAYRFWDSERNCLVSDNDDDGEKGAGVKLALLLEMADAQNVIVVVSRWYGGVHLGSSRFKYFASVARDALKDAGLIGEKR